ncbi:BglG family transcription antiterminator [Lacticaseibacillus paracasei]|uniref:BglG family transcription antiterminator n=1 Tax=Lacticaseibacillus paracasei TaxID=1597 RepID=UPI000F43B40B|nr:PTS sugar transporter subunit IIA [Lacticaseibacillus paracasei]
MKLDKMKQLVRILLDADKPYTAGMLSKLVGVSERTIRHYVSQINTAGYASIDSSSRGYQLSQAGDFLRFKRVDDGNRVYAILSRLLDAEGGVSVFDLSEQLMVSESTILNTDVPKLRQEMLPFELDLKTRDYVLSMVGNEENKRKLIGYMVTHNSYGFFSAEDILSKLFPGYEIRKVMKRLYDICNQSNLFINNFAMNNLLVHLAIILIRLQGDAKLMPRDTRTKNVRKLLRGNPQNEDILKLSVQISNCFTDEFGRSFPPQDYDQIVVLISLSVDSNPEEIDGVMGRKFINFVQESLNLLSQRYGLPDFDYRFVSQFALHMYNVRRRSEFGVSYPNPITLKVKKDYAPVYDMAVFFAHQFAVEYRLRLSEGEIGFIAFHLGAYLENNQKQQLALSCVIVVEGYLDFGKSIVKTINTRFKGRVTVSEVMSLDEFALTNPKRDMVISTVEMPTHASNLLVVNPLLTSKDIAGIDALVGKLNEQLRKKLSKEFFQRLFSPQLFFRNVQCKSPEEYIRFMGGKCEALGLVGSTFVDDVVLRENVSSTAFTESLAVPHAINQFARKSFICILHNDEAIPWTSGSVHFILLIGISKEQMQNFNELFDLLVDLFMDSQRLAALLRSNSFSDFMSELYL